MATAMPKKSLGYYQIISLYKLYKKAKKKKSLYVLLFHGIVDCKQFYEGKFTTLWCVCVCVCVCFPHNLRSSLTHWNRSHKQCCWSIWVQFRLCAVYLSIYPAKCFCLVKLINSEEQLILEYFKTQHFIIKCNLLYEMSQDYHFVAPNAM